MYSDEDPKMDLFLSTNKRWKRMRNIINPTFSPAKLKEVYRILLIKKEIIKKANFFVWKQLMPIMKRTTDRLIQELDKNLDQDIIISE